MNDSFALLREELGEQPWILSCENSGNYAYAPENFQNRVHAIIKEKQKVQAQEWAADPKAAVKKLSPKVTEDE